MRRTLLPVPRCCAIDCHHDGVTFVLPVDLIDDRLGLLPIPVEVELIEERLRRGNLSGGDLVQGAGGVG